MMKTAPTTDRQRVRALFAAVRKELGAIARMNFSCCSSCASAELFDKAKEGQAVVFYHHQDEQRAWADDCFTLSDSGLMIRYGAKVSEGDALNEYDLSLTIAKVIVKLAGELGLKTEWDGEVTSCIQLLHDAEAEEAALKAARLTAYKAKANARALLIFKLDETLKTYDAVGDALQLNWSQRSAMRAAETLRYELVMERIADEAAFENREA